MNQKTASVYIRIEPEIKEQAEKILSALGIPVSGAINMFYKQIILHRGLPFAVRLPDEKPLDYAELAGRDYENDRIDRPVPSGEATELPRSKQGL